MTKFYRETQFKETEIGRIPEDWEVVRLGEKDYFEVIMGQSPPSSSYNEEGVGMPFLQGSAEFGTLHPSTQKFTDNPKKIGPKGSILISVRAPVGDVNIADRDYCIGRGLAAIKTVQGKVSNIYVFYLISYFKSYHAPFYRSLSDCIF